jgi:hypothetical protein
MKDFTPEYADDRSVPPSSGVVVPFNLPPSYTVRWVPRRKANVVAAVQAGILSMTEACFRYRLSPEEFLEWERQYKAGELTRPRTSPKKPAFH